MVLLVVWDASYLWGGRDIGVDVRRGLDQLDRTLLALPPWDQIGNVSRLMCNIETG